MWGWVAVTAIGIGISVWNAIRMQGTESEAEAQAEAKAGLLPIPQFLRDQYAAEADSKALADAAAAKAAEDARRRQRQRDAARGFRSREQTLGAGADIPYEAYKRRINGLGECALKWALRFVPPGLSVEDSVRMALTVEPVGPKCVYDFLTEKLEIGDCADLFLRSYIPGYTDIGTQAEKYAPFFNAVKRYKVLHPNTPLEPCVQARWEQIVRIV